MRKNLFFIAATALLIVSCSEEKLRSDIQDEPINIGFSTSTARITRAENSSATDSTALLQTYHNSFKVWGSKYVAGTESTIFTAQVVNHNGTDWTYTPIRFWDKSATSYDFYAAAPSGLNWAWDNDNKKLSLANFEVDGATLAPSATVDAKAIMPNNKDIMISEDVTGYNNYTSAKVNLSFIHLLSRLNIGVKKATPLLDDFIVKLDTIVVYNMVKNGSFDESTPAVPNGSTARWDDADSPAKFTDGVGYYTETEVTASLNYVYQSLVIPQTVAYEANIKLDSTNITANSKPYIKISYEIWTKDVKFTQDEIDNAQDGDPAFGKSTDDIKERSYMVDRYRYFFNLADIFNGDDATTDVDFFEGWMNTLKITINPTAIEFDADVYEWAEKTPVDVDVPEINPAD